MRKLLTICIIQFALLAGSLPLPANAHTIDLLPGRQSYTPIEKAACQGWGRWCPPGFVRACGPYRCWCRPCR
ncbi:hypothetical protein [Methylocystis sp. S23]|jgi:hypothetical protein